MLVQIDEAGHLGSVADPPRRSDEVAPLLPLDLDARAGARRRERLALVVGRSRVERREDAVVFGRIPRAVSVRDWEGSSRRFLLEARLASVGAGAEAHAAHARHELHVTLAQVLPVEGGAPFGNGLGEPALTRLQAFGAEPVEDSVWSVSTENVEVQDALPVNTHALLERHRVPVGGPRLGVKAPVVVLGDGVVPENVDADARIEVELEEADRDEARLVLRPPGEKIVDLPRQLRFLRRGDRERERLANDVLGREVERERGLPEAPRARQMRRGGSTRGGRGSRGPAASATVGEGARRGRARWQRMTAERATVHPPALATPSW